MHAGKRERHFQEEIKWLWSFVVLYGWWRKWYALNEKKTKKVLLLSIAWIFTVLCAINFIPPFTALLIIGLGIVLIYDYQAKIHGTVIIVCSVLSGILGWVIAAYLLSLSM